MKEKEFGRDVTKRLSVLLATTVLGIGGIAVAYQAEIIGGTSSDEPTLDCSDELQEVYIPEGGSWYGAAESVDMGPGVLQGDVADVIKNMHGGTPPLAQQNITALIPVSCEVDD